MKGKPIPILISLWLCLPGIGISQISIRDDFSSTELNQNIWSVRASDPAIRTEVSNGELRIWGRTSDQIFGDNGVWSKFYDHAGSFSVEVSFKVPVLGSGLNLIYLSMESSDGVAVALGFQGSTYFVQAFNPNVFVGSVAAFGNERSTFHKVSLIYANGVITGKVDGITVGTINRSLSNVSFHLVYGTDSFGIDIDLRFDDFLATVFVPPPTIGSFSPTSGPIGTTVTITGTNFNTTASNNIVYFGAVRVPQSGITAASSTSLTVTVPAGATYAPITVTVGGLTGCSRLPFIVTFPGGGSITASSFAAKVDFTTGTSPWDLAIGDVDGDGKPDVAVANRNSNTFSIFRNTSTSGSITASSFASKVDFTTGTEPRSVAIGDIDGDGKPDLAVINWGSNTVSVFRNTSTSGSITFAAKVDFTTGADPYSVAIGDLDGDGKPDLAVTNVSSNTVSVFRNTSVSGSITFASKVDFTTGTVPRSVAIGDVDGDGKPDLAVANTGGNTVSVLRNTSTSGSITASSFASKVDFTTGEWPYSVAIGDVDGDGKPDLAVSNSQTTTVSVIRNTSTSGSITASSFASKVDFTTGTVVRSVAIGDVDGDGKPDLAVASYNSTTVSVFRNTSISGSITASSFASKVDFTTGASPFSVAIGDIDGDGKPDLAIANYGSNTVSVLRNTMGADPYEPNNTANLAKQIAYGFKSQGTELNPEGDVDYFKFSASAGDFVEIQAATDETSGLDVRLTLYDQAGTELVTNDNVSTGIERILYGFDKQGIYYIRIAEAANADHFPNGVYGKVSGLRASKQVSPTGAYTLTLALGSPLPPILLIAGSGFDHLVPLHWNPPASNSPSAYRIYRSTSQTTAGSLIGASSREDYVDTTAVNGVSYFYHVTSVYAATDKESAVSNTSSATALSGGFKLTSKFLTAKPTLDGVIQAAEWSDAAAEDITIRRGANPPSGVTVFYKNDDRFLYLAVDDSNGTANTYNNLILAFDRDNNNTWDATSPSSEGIILIDDSVGVAVVRFFGVTGSYPGFDIDPAVRNPNLVQAELSYKKGHIQYEVALDLSRLAPSAAQGGTMGVFLATVSDDPSGEYPFGALVFAPITFADLSVKPVAQLPTVTTNPATFVSATSAGLNGTVNPGGQNATAWFEYGTDSSLTSSSTTLAKQILAATSDIIFSDGITGLSTGTRYYYRLVAQNSVGIQRGSIRNFITVPSPPLLELPANGATDQLLSINFSWKASTGATLYRLQISTSNSFASLFLDDSTITDIRRVVTSFLNNTTYFWRVGAKNASGTSEYSNIFSFTTVAAGPTAPTLSSPANGATGVSTNPTLSWSASTGAASYRLQVSTSSAFTATVFDDSTLTSTSRQVGPLANNTTYYWHVSAKNAGGTSAYSTTANFATIATMTVSSPSPISFPANPTVSTDYRLFSIPGGSTLTVSDLLSGTQKIDWRIYRDNGAATNYLVELAATSTFTPGEGYWLLKKGPFSITSRNVQAVTLSSDATYSIPLNASGWTIVGNPFDKSVSWANVLAANGITTSASELLRDYNGTYTSTTTMDPYKGYYYFNSSSRTSLKIPYPFSGRIDVFNSPPVDWQLQLKFSSDINEDSENYIGISAAAADEFDALESYKPPLFLDQGFLYFNRPKWNTRYSKFSSDYRPALGDGQVWEFEVSNPRMSQGRIHIKGIEQVPIAYDVKLIDSYNNEPFDLRLNNTYSYRTMGERMSFKLLVGNREFVQKEVEATLPQEFELTQNFPNPFNPSTAISIKLPHDASVKVEIVSLLGQHVKTLVEGRRNAGTHTFVWDGRNEYGQTVASGAYFYRLFVEGTLVKSRRMLLAR